MRTGSAEPEAERLVLKIGKQRAVCLVRPEYLDAEPLLQIHCAAGMVDMAMCQPDRTGRDRMVVERLEDLVDITARIDDDAGLVVRVEQDRAVLLKRSDRDNPGVELTHPISFPSTARGNTPPQDRK